MGKYWYKESIIYELHIKGSKDSSNDGKGDFRGLISKLDYLTDLFWFDLGLDGFRIDAVPYLFEQEGTDCENLPETHDYIKELRHFIDKNYSGRVLLAESNQWPEDLVSYFGYCHIF